MGHTPITPALERQKEAIERSVLSGLQSEMVSVLNE